MRTLLGSELSGKIDSGDRIETAISWPALTKYEVPPDCILKRGRLPQLSKFNQMESNPFARAP
jgi:hypothetical protein